jgi:ABC-type bacteriocin/lantibiotic exporter with double-glycine peptidase domain
METVELTFQYTQEEYVRAARQYLRASKIFGRKFIIADSLAALCAIFCLLYFPGTLAILFLACVALLILIILAVYFYVPARNFRVSTPVAASRAPFASRGWVGS